MSGYQIVRELGRGSSGIVYLVRRRSDGRFFAAKEILFSDKEEHDQIMAEVQLMHSLPQHPSLLSLEDVLESRSSITMVLEYSQEGTLHELVYGSKGEKTQGLAEEDVVRYVTQLVNALAFLHSNDVLHRDIKLENLLLFSQRAVVKISDFGTSTILGRTATGHDRLAQTTAGTPNYMSPEVCEGSPYHFKSDVWSLGIVAYEMCCQAVPFQANNLLALTGKICHQATPDLPNEYSRRLNAIVKAMLTKNQHSRPSMKEVAAMFQYYRRKLADGSPDGPDIGGFTVDPTILPNLLDDEDYLLTDEAPEPKSPTLGAPSLGAPETQEWDDPMQDGFFHHPSSVDPTHRREMGHYAPDGGGAAAAAGGGGSGVYHTSDLLTRTSPAAAAAQRTEVPGGGAIVSTHSTMIQDPKSPKGFSPSIRQAIFSEARRQAQEQARLHDDEQLVTERPKSPRLRSLIEELQEEMKKQSAKVDSLLLDHSNGTRDSSDGAYVRGGAGGGTSGLQRSSPIPKSNSPPPPFVDPASTPTKIRKVPSPTRLPTPPPSPSQLPPSSPTEFSPRESDAPTAFVTANPIQSPRVPDKASTPRQAHHPPKQRGSIPVGVPTKHSGATEAEPPAKSNAHKKSERAGATSPTPRDPPLPPPKATPRTAGERGGGKGTPPPVSQPVRVPRSSPPTDALVPPPETGASGTTLPVGAAPARPPRTVTRLNSKDDSITSSKAKDAPYFPPCAQCIKMAKEHRASLVDGLAADTSNNAFYTIRPSKLYCSTCHAPLCAECSKIVHDPLTTTTNLQQLSISTSMDENNAKNSLSGKRHNLFFLSLSDPSQSLRSSPPAAASPAAPQPLTTDLAASPTNSQRRASVTFQPHSEDEHRRDRKTSSNSQDKEFLGCCTFM